ncbi:DNA/RNA nuclease SfsA, partial [Candidatus Sumerlaeota bacterium]|nr:DNA/RNA nuclease SfsA [Candidatus Sumerlaeota bacterium]
MFYEHRFPQPLTPGVLIKRYKRFMADVQLKNGDVVTAHCVNTGSMEGIALPGLKVWLSPADNPNRKLKWNWELVQKDGQLIGANTALPNAAVFQAIQQRLLPGFKQWTEARAEVKYNSDSRIDVWLKHPSGIEHFIEIKNCHLSYPDKRAYFPDTASVRATKHLRELEKKVREGHKATVIFFVQAPQAESCRPSDVHDPAFAATAREVWRSGIEFKAILAAPSP